MRRSRTLVMAAAAALGFGLVSVPVAVAAPGTAAPAKPAANPDMTPKRVCDQKPAADAKSAQASCLALIQTGKDGKPLTAGRAASNALPPGYGPAQLQTAYGLTKAATERGGDQTVAITIAFDVPNAEEDLAAYRETYGLPPCTTANGCFQKVNQNGESGPLPAPNPEWALEASLDLDMVSAACPRCHILLVEADDNGMENLGMAVATAARLGATQITNSWGTPDSPGVGHYEPFFDHSDVSIFAASGDSGYGPSYPASAGNVVAVGGTSLWPAGGTRGYREYAWGQGGSGCSTQIARPSWQPDNGCGKKSVADVAAVADPYTAVAVYDTYGVGGWVRLGGTSASSPIVAGFYALLGDDAHKAEGGSWIYSHKEKFFDVTSGSNHSGSCSPANMCAAGAGYDGPTGVGTPNYTQIDGTADGCVNNWSQVPSPSMSEEAGGGVLSETQGVAAMSDNDVWTAGFYFENAFNGPFESVGWGADIQHWNGTTWEHTSAPQPLIPQSQNLMANPRDIEFSGPKDGWVVGARNDPTPLVEHWDGTRWSLSPVLTPDVRWTGASGSTVLAKSSAEGVAAISSTDAWLVLNTSRTEPDENGGLSTGSFLEHWDGHEWSFVDFPGSDNRKLQLNDVWGTSSDNVWAVGHEQISSMEFRAVALHWDGQKWTSTSPVHDTDVTSFNAVSGTGPNDVWAVGTGDQGAANGPLVEHWDGSRWTRTQVEGSDPLVSSFTDFEGVTVNSPDDVWAAGRWNQWNYLVGHWDGTRWAVVQVPQERPNALWGIDSSGPGNVWAVGADVRHGDQFGGGVYTYAIRNRCGGE
ncbi:MAG TPA: S53 family peptidase [Mycobacteriales bacterium]